MNSFFNLGNFEKLSSFDVDFPDNYDYHSIMHYDGYAFGKVDNYRKIRLATMIPKKVYFQIILHPSILILVWNRA